MVWSYGYGYMCVWYEGIFVFPSIEIIRCFPSTQWVRWSWVSLLRDVAISMLESLSWVFCSLLILKLFYYYLRTFRFRSFPVNFWSSEDIKVFAGVNLFSLIGGNIAHISIHKWISYIGKHIAFKCGGVGGRSGVVCIQVERHIKFTDNITYRQCIHSEEYGAQHRPSWDPIFQRLGGGFCIRYRYILGSALQVRLDPLERCPTKFNVNG